MYLVGFGDGWVRRYPKAPTIAKRGAKRRPQPDINPIMIFAWAEILPTAIERLPPLHREILMYVMNQPGKRRPSYAYASERWGLTRAEFDVELAEAYASVRQYLRRYGLDSADDLATGRSLRSSTRSTANAT
jgi:hypothetical protein